MYVFSFCCSIVQDGLKIDSKFQEPQTIMGNGRINGTKSYWMEKIAKVIVFPN